MLEHWLDDAVSHCGVVDLLLCQAWGDALIDDPLSGV